MDFKTISFLSTILIGVGANLGMIIAAAMLGNVSALGFALSSSALAYLCQMTVTYEAFGAAIPSWVSSALQLLAVAAWVIAFYMIAF